jgi:hypothetical protein
MLNIIDFSKYKDGEDWTPALNEALAITEDGIFFPQGTYHFYAKHALREYCFFINNDEGLKSIIFNIENKENMTISGNQAEFIFHGRVVPFRCKATKALSLEGISIDFDKSFIVQAKVLTVSDSSMTLGFQDGQFYRVINNKICFVDDEYKFMSKRIPFMAYDLQRLEPLAGGAIGDFSIEATEIGKNTVRFDDFTKSPKVGETIVMKPEPRLCPGIILDECSDVNLKGVNIYHCGGMAILGQNSHNIALENIVVALKENSARLISASDDAVHFAQCSGYINIRNCRFENQWDDGINIHGVYRSYLKRLDQQMLKVEHYQQLGVEIVRPGETLLIDNYPVKVQKVLSANKQYSVIITEPEIPEHIITNATVVNLDRNPDVCISNCTFNKNKPRGVLVSSGGKVLIENNYFHTPGAAIYIAGNNTFWYEAGPVKDMTIRNNTFENCLYHKACTGKAVIDIDPEVKIKDHFYHHNISIENNNFADSHRRLLHAVNSDNISFINNRWNENSEYPTEKISTPVQSVDCGKIVLKNNDYDISSQNQVTE